MVSRMATETISVVDMYCEEYRDLFTEVRTFENFKYFHVGILSDIKHKYAARNSKSCRFT
ncbi:hypothetical protein CAL7716_099590 (plasmid) [Calothrix sp. PCC 7716]|nr:hypothetical protein CAL7716_099590 [Calothrix sp. PCC 7716]